MDSRSDVILVTPRSFRRTEGPHRDRLRESSYQIVDSPREDSLLTEDEMIALCEDHDPVAIIVGLDPITESVLHHADNLQVVAKYGTGLDNVDLDTARHRGVTLTYTPGANTQSVADLALGLMLSVMRRIPRQDRSLREGHLDRRQGSELWNKTLGIVGLGQIGSAVGRRATGFSMNILYHDVRPMPAQEAALDAEYVEFEPCLRRSDVVSLHCVLNDQTRGLIGQNELQWMADDAVLINTARWGLIDEEALEDALREDRLAGAGLDTFDSEEELSSELLKLDNVVATPHCGASTRESVLRMAEMAVEDTLRVLRGESPRHPVD